MESIKQILMFALDTDHVLITTIVCVQRDTLELSVKHQFVTHSWQLIQRYAPLMVHANHQTSVHASLVILETIVNSASAMEPFLMNLPSALDMVNV